MKIEIEVTNQRLLDVIGDANISYWGESAPATGTSRIKRMLASKATLVIIEDGDEELKVKHELTSDKVYAAIRLMSKKYPHKLYELLEDTESDMYTGDILIQLAIFGEVKYG